MGANAPQRQCCTVDNTRSDYDFVVKAEARAKYACNFAKARSELATSLESASNPLEESRYRPRLEQHPEASPDEDVVELTNTVEIEGSLTYLHPEERADTFIDEEEEKIPHSSDLNAFDGAEKQDLFITDPKTLAKGSEKTSYLNGENEALAKKVSKKPLAVKVNRTSVENGEKGQAMTVENLLKLAESRIKTKGDDIEISYDLLQLPNPSLFVSTSLLEVNLVDLVRRAPKPQKRLPKPPKPREPKRLSIDLRSRSYYDLK